MDLIECIVAVLLCPQRAAQGIEVHAKTVAYSVGKNLFDISRSFAGQICIDVEEWIVAGRRAVVIQSKNDAGQMCIVRFRSTKLVVRNGTTALEVLQEASPAVVAENDVKLAVRTKAHYAAVVITTRRLAGVLLQRSQLDQVAIECECR